MNIKNDVKKTGEKLTLTPGVLGLGLGTPVLGLGLRIQVPGLGIEPKVLVDITARCLTVVNL